MISAKQIADFLGEKLAGPPSTQIDGPCSLNRPGKGKFAFVTQADPLNLEPLPSLLLVLPGQGANYSCPTIEIENPRLAFARAMENFFSQLGRGSTVVTGRNPQIHPQAVIGGQGFGFERDPKGVPVRVPHVGKVVIGDNVEVGACTCINRGTIDDTVIGDNVKIDDHVFIAHNVQIGQNTLVIAGAVICGSTIIGEGAWIGAGSVIRESLKVGDGALIGMGAVVVKDVPPGVTVAGNPARPLGVGKG